MPADQTSVYHFGRFTLDLARGTLRDGIRDLRLRPKSFAVLKVLVENHGCLVSKNDLIEEAWSGSAVSDDSLTQCLIEIRRALDDADKSLVRTVPRRGYLFDGTVEAGIRSPETAQATRNSPIVIRLAIGLLMLAATAGWWLAMQPATPEPDTEITRTPWPENSIAVLPFVDLSDEQHMRYFGESLSEEVINLLSQTPDLHIVARTSSFSFRDTSADVATIAEQLNVRFLLEGSVRETDGNIRVVAQFIDTNTDRHLWSRPFDASLQGAIDVQSDIALAVANELQVQLGVTDSLSNSTDPITYNLFGHAREIINGRDLSRLPEAIDLLQQALQRDPNFVRGRFELGRAYYQQRLTDQASWDQALENAWQETDRALVLAPDDAVGNAWKGWREFLHNNNYEKAALHFRRAFAVDPRNADIIRAVIPFLLTIGRIDQAVRLSDYLVAHNPLCLICQRFKIFAYVSAYRYSEAEQYLRSLIVLYPDNSDLQILLAETMLLQEHNEQALSILESTDAPSDHLLRSRLIAQHRLGLTAEYQETLAQLITIGDRFPTTVAMAYAAVGNADSAFEWLVKEDGRGNVTGEFFRHPVFDELRQDPRWQDYLDKFDIWSDEEFANLNFEIEIPD